MASNERSVRALSPSGTLAAGVRHPPARDESEAPRLFANAAASPEKGPKEPKWIVPLDCREAMATMSDDSVSLVLADPPYFLDGMDDGWSHADLARRTLPAGVVGSLPVGMKFDVSQGPRLQNFLAPICVDWIRLLRPGGFALCFSQNRLVHHAAMAMEHAGFEVRDVLAWRYEGQPKAFGQEHFVLQRNIPRGEKLRLIRKLGGRKTPQLKPQCELIVLGQRPLDGTFVDNWDRWETGLIDVTAPHLEPMRFPGTVMWAPKPRRRLGHLTTKPVDLLRHLIRIFSRKGSLVFDPFAGSGSAGVAARLEGRDFFGAEIDPGMAAAAEERVAREGPCS